jgi:hypothetical protein
MQYNICIKINSKVTEVTKINYNNALLIKHLNFYLDQIYHQMCYIPLVSRMNLLEGIF